MSEEEITQEAMYAWEEEWNGATDSGIPPISDDFLSGYISAKKSLNKSLNIPRNFLSIVNQSIGVSGWHMNGDIARWDEFDEFIMWLEEFCSK